MHLFLDESWKVRGTVELTPLKWLESVQLVHLRTDMHTFHDVSYISWLFTMTIHEITLILGF